MNLFLRQHEEERRNSPDEPHQIGTQDGELCNRYEEPDEDAPRGYRPKPCTGTMTEQDGKAVCDKCGETA